MLCMRCPYADILVRASLQKRPMAFILKMHAIGSDISVIQIRAGET